MKKVCKRWKFWGLMLGLMLFAAGFAMHSTTVETQAAVNGFRTVAGKTYYYKNGKKVKSWITVGKNKYYMNKKTGAAYKGWYKVKGNRKRYFDPRTGAMKRGLTKINGKYYYFDGSTGWAKSGFLRAKNGNTRYFSPTNYTMAKGWMKNSKNQKWYFDTKSGLMYKGKKKVGKYYYYFDPKTGGTQKGFITASNGNTRYFRGGTYCMATGWIKNSKGQKRYFYPSNGIMFKGLRRVSGKWYYFDKSSGIAQGGWVTENGEKRYFDPKTFIMVTGTKTIDGKKYQFNSNGVLISQENDVVNNNPVTPTTPSSERTVKNYLLNAMQPVGRTLYIWGGGHNESDATRKGISTKWTSFYNSQNSSYDYNNYRDLSESNRSKGLDCSGYIGWSVYQVMGIHSTVVSGEIGGLYKSRGWGSCYNQKYLSNTGYKLYPGDIGYDANHTWMILGQCNDKSAVILHSTPNAGVQIAGTPTPSGNYSSQAVALAEKYMARFPGYQKMQKTNSKFYHTSTGAYVRRGSYFRWNSKTLSDPNGYRYKTADQILADLFS